MELGLTKSSKCGILELNMFDRIVYKILDTIVKWCERYKEYKIKRSLPKATYDEKAKEDDLKKWVNGRENSYK